MLTRALNKHFFGCCAVCVILFLLSCSKSVPEEAILANIESMQQGLEERKASKSIEFMAESFVGSHGLDKKTLRKVLIGQFLRHKNITVVITRMDIEVNPNDPSSATMEGVVVATGADRYLPKDGHIYKVRGDWQQQDDEWVLLRLSWE